MLHLPRSLTAFLALIALVAGLSACTSSPASVPQPEGRFDYTMSVDLAPGDSEAAVAERYGAQVLVWRPDAGFAVLGLAGTELIPQSLSAEANRGRFASPTRDAAGSGFQSWSGGFQSWSGGFQSWSGGFQSWSGGFQSWSGGFQSWSGGVRTGTPMDNLDRWLKIGLPDAHMRLSPKLGEGVTVAVLDTGVDLRHPALAGRLTAGWDFIDNDGEAQDLPGGAAFGHGTGVAGLVLQIAPNARIMPLRVLDPSGLGDTDDIAQAIDWAIAHGADVINLSLGSELESQVLDRMIRYAGDQGVYLVASAGNAGRKALTYPAASANGSESIGVGSVDDHDVKSAFSNYGNGLKLVAPGEALFTSAPDDRFTYWTGTSFATPLVSGALALGLAETTASSTVKDMAKLLLRHAVKVKDLPGNDAYSKDLGDGRLHIPAFLRALEIPDYGVGFRATAKDEWKTDYASKNDDVAFEIRADDGSYNPRHIDPASVRLLAEDGSGVALTPSEVKVGKDKATVKFDDRSHELYALLVAPTEGSSHTLTLTFDFGAGSSRSVPVTVQVKE